MPSQDNVTVGLTDETHALLQQMKEEGVFKEMVDGYRFGIALAIARDEIAEAGINLGTVFNVGTLDPEGLIRTVITELYPEAAAPYSIAERLAEWGVAELGRLYSNRLLKFSQLLEPVTEDNAAEPA